MPRFFPPPGLFQDPKPLFEQLFPQQTIVGGMEGVAGEPGPTIGQLLGNLYPGPEAQIMGLATPLSVVGPKLPATRKITEFAKELLGRAKKTFTTGTGIFPRTGYLLPDGEFIHMLGPGAEHQTIGRIFPPEEAISRGIVDPMQTFMRETGAIRVGMSPTENFTLVDIVKPITPEQIKSLMGGIPKDATKIEITIPGVAFKEFQGKTGIMQWLSKMGMIRMTK